VIGLVGALKEEVGELCSQFGLRPIPAERGMRLYKGRLGGEDVFAVQSGIGRYNAERATGFLLRRHPVRLVVALGFGGGLSPALRPGELVLCLRLHCESAPGGCCRPDPGFLSLAARASSAESLQVRLGNSVTVGRLVTRSSEKLALGQAYRAQAVDMESYWVARLACSHRVPFIAVRAISDPLQQSIPRLDRVLGPAGDLSWRRALVRFATHPCELARLPRLGLNARTAARALAAFVGALVARL
jgi:adenosylhomocysteine nucleosidase